jgi:hypothetical protein
VNNKNVFEGSLILYDQLGQLVKVIHDGSFIAGPRTYFFDAAGISSGMYQLVLTTPSGIITQKLGIGSK